MIRVTVIKLVSSNSHATVVPYYIAIIYCYISCVFLLICNLYFSILIIMWFHIFGFRDFICYHLLHMVIIQLLRLAIQYRLLPVGSSYLNLFHGIIYMHSCSIQFYYSSLLSHSSWLLNFQKQFGWGWIMVYLVLIIVSYYGLINRSWFRINMIYSINLFTLTLNCYLKYSSSFFRV